ncbi:MAG TPA: hypothetical protein VLB44_18300 [Kofleriaceae bacterium]|nr:hypothetical protein [Kofleriaceae bacterium]
MKHALLLVVVAATGCVDPIDARWQLDHDHVIAARATPPRIRAGEATNLDALVAHTDGPVTIENPMSAEVATSGFERYLQRIDGAWRLEAPDAQVLAAARPGLHIADDAPVPVDVLLTFPHPAGLDRASPDPFRVKKTVWLGEPSANPVLPDVTVDGQPAPDETSDVVLPIGRDVYVAVDAPQGLRVNWLTNVGTLFQDDVARAYIRVSEKDRRDGQLVVVVRDSEGGVAWRVWSMRAQ